ncbi:hypothetical protein QNI19_16395 [Cytophagaceae bacterium DM2B3-1]|uniref:Transporter n=1 Tax=Xanthocytophaga flava TaxID=3048013 RepID=A0ABT7CLV6_9BACT|nr:hypothetical protein [Xanthocytophaga flavus]MDJ1494526.1 hypothetical protein [Xanthocytophaga flavus]
MKERIKKTVSLLIETFHELPGLLLGLIVFLLFSAQMGFDVSVLQVLPYAAINIIFAEFVAYWGVRLGFPYLYNAHKVLIKLTVEEITGLSETEYKHIFQCVKYYYILLLTLFSAMVIVLLQLRY